MKRVTICLFIIGFFYIFTPGCAAAPMNTSDSLEVEQFAKYINGLNVHELETISGSRERALKLMPKLGQPARDQVFLEFEKHYRRVLQIHCELWSAESTNSTLAQDLAKKIEKAQLHWTNGEIKTHPYYRLLHQNGCDIYWSEGGPYVDQQPDYLSRSFKQYVSPPIVEFLNYRAHDFAEGFIEDAGLVIPFSKVGGRVNKWEKYLAKYPCSPYKDLAKELYDSYLVVFIYGIENSRLFDDDTGVLDPKVRATYEAYIKQHPDSPSGKLIGEYLRVLKDAGYHDGPAIHDFFRNKHIDTAFKGYER